MGYRLPKDDEESAKQYQEPKPAAQAPAPRAPAAPKQQKPDSDYQSQRETSQGGYGSYRDAEAAQRQQWDTYEANKPWEEKVRDKVNAGINYLGDKVYDYTGVALPYAGATNYGYEDPDSQPSTQQDPEELRARRQSKSTPGIAEQMTQTPGTAATTEDPNKPVDPYAGMTPAEKRDAIYMDSLKKTRQGEAQARGDYVQGLTKYRDQIEAQNQDYLKQIKELNDKQTAAESSFRANQESLASQAAQQATDANKQYSDLRSKQSNLMDQRIANANQALSLRDASDPNNAVAQATRSLYNTEATRTEGLADTYANKIQSDYGTLAQQLTGQYDKDIAATQKRGMSDAGALAALGSKATADQFAGSTASGSQLLALNAANQGQSQTAYNTAMARAAALQDQRRQLNETLQQQGLGTATARRSGLQDQALGTRQAGIGTSLDQSWRNFGAGQQERDAATSLSSQLASQDLAQAGLQSSLRGEQSGYGASSLASQRAQTDYSKDYSDLGYQSDAALREYDMNYDSLKTQNELARLAAERGDYQTEQELAAQREAFTANKDALAAQLAEARKTREEAQNAGYWGAGGGLVGGVLGGIYGGPAGAAAGSALGNKGGEFLGKILGR